LRYDALTRALLNLAEAGGRPPCSDYSARPLFLSEFVGERRVAQKLCTHCPVKAECLESALEHDTRFGVFGGVDFTVREGRKKKTA
jgi:Transcription factor WhiB